MQANKADIKITRRHAILIGLLLIVSSVTAVASQLILDPLLQSPNFLGRISEQLTPFTVGILLELIYAITAFSIAAAFYVILKESNQSIAVTYLGFRSIEATLSLGASICFLSLLTLCQFCVGIDIPPGTDFYSLGIILIAMHDWAWFTMLIIFYISGFILNTLLLLKKLVAPSIAVLGLVGALLGLTGCLLQLFGVILDKSGLASLFFLPFSIQEIILAIYLIVKGFRYAQHVSNT